MPAASKIDATRYAVVVLPLVPVMPITRISRLGWPAERGGKQREGESRIAHRQPGRLQSGRRGFLRDDGHGAALERLRDERRTVRVLSFQRDEDMAGTNAARIVRDPGDRHLIVRGPGRILTARLQQAVRARGRRGGRP